LHAPLEGSKVTHFLASALHALEGKKIDVAHLGQHLKKGASSPFR